MPRAGPSKLSQEAVAQRLDLPAAEAPQRVAHAAPVALEHLAPALIAELGRGAGGVDDVREQHGREDAIGLGRVAGAGQELLHLVDQLLGALAPGQVVAAGQLDQLGVRQVLGEPAAVADVHEPVEAAVQHERGHLDASAPRRGRRSR